MAPIATFGRHGGEGRDDPAHGRLLHGLPTLWRLLGANETVFFMLDSADKMKLSLLPVWIIAAGCSQLAGQDMGSPLPTATRIDVKQDSGWRRASVSEDFGPSSATMKVRLEPNDEFTIVPRKSVRLAPRPASISVGDRLEWCGRSVTSFQCVPATVKGLGTGDYAAYYLMAWDKYPNSATYDKPERLWQLPEGATSASKVIPGAPTPGKFHCSAYGAVGNPPIFLGTIELQAGGSYSVAGKPGQYTYDAATHSITWLSGWAKTNGFKGAVESNALIRLHSNTICAHE